MPTRERLRRLRHRDPGRDQSRAALDRAEEMLAAAAALAADGADRDRRRLRSGRDVGRGRPRPCGAARRGPSRFDRQHEPGRDRAGRSRRRRAGALRQLDQPRPRRRLGLRGGGRARRARRRWPGLDETIARLAAAGVPLRIDPILEPIGFGFAASLGRYLEVRAQYPDAEMMMGIGNLTELTDADSAAINVLLLGFCQELGIRSVLTTQVINWARTSVRECDLRGGSCITRSTTRTLPKHVEPRLVTLRDPKIHQHASGELDRLADEIKDPNYRVFAEEGQLHLVSAKLHLAAADPFDLLKQLLVTSPKNVDAEHAFYLGYELCKAVTALTLSKDYRQDQALDWGFLTREEKSHRDTE